jgi:hypothetical protein
VSAEAVGRVRAELRPLIDPPETSVIHRIGDLIEERTAKFRDGRRLSELELAQLRRRCERLLPHAAAFGEQHHYGQARWLQLGIQDGFTENMLELRTATFGWNRRKITYVDRTLGLQFSAHALGRLIERGEVDGPVAPYVVAHGRQLLPWLFLLRFGYGADLTVALPFRGGLAFGELIHLSILPSTHYQSDDEGSGFVTVDGWTPFRDLAGKVIGCRITSYLAFDQLNAAQEDLHYAWMDVEAEHAALWPHLTDIACGRDVPVEEEALLGTRPAIARLTAGRAWSAVVRPSDAAAKS